MSIGAMILSEIDTVAIALTDWPAGETRAGVTAVEEIKRGHKIARLPMAKGDPVIKYGQMMGIASEDIAVGAHVHTHNCGFPRDHAEMPAPRATAPEPPERRSFEGYLRPDGRVGTRNYIGILASVNCSTTVCDAIAAEANRTLLPKYPGIDGFAPLIHGQGCGMEHKGPDYDALIRVMKGYRDHPNFGGIIIVGLGCEVNQLTLYPPNDWTRDRYHSFNMQEVGGSRSAVRRALELLEPIASAANRDRRTTQDISRLILGMQCGGSDGFSGITCNPALGHASDLLVAAGGTSILSETPEIFGAEHLLISRANSEDGARLRGMIDWWRDYAARNGTTLDNNPSPGNKRGGLTTILEKSLGAVAKGGVSSVSGVYGYAERIDGPGFVYMDSPGYDPVVATGQIAAGANALCFTTGRGSCAGYKPTPSLKLASNSEMARNMAEDMDIDCGVIVDRGVPIAEMGRRIYDSILDMASGQKTKSEALGYGDNEFVPWKIGATL